MTPLSFLAVDPGASHSTIDVYNGYVVALRQQGHTVREYRLNQRIDDAGAYYTNVYRRKKLGVVPPALVLTKAASDVVTQALYHRVDGVLIFSGMFFAPDYLVLLRRAGIPTALLLSESPYDLEQEARVVPYVDVAFTNERSAVPTLRDHNPQTFYLPHAYSPAISFPATPAADTPRCDVLFIGTLFEERIRLLGAVDWSGIDFAVHGAAAMVPSRHRLRRHLRGGVIPNHQVQDYYRAAAININVYRSSKGFGRFAEHIDHAESLSPRAVELAACGAFHLSQDRAEVGETFGDAVPTFADAGQLSSLIRHYLDRPDERAALAARLPACVAERTFDRQAEFMVSTLRAAWQGSERGPRQSVGHDLQRVAAGG